MTVSPGHQGRRLLLEKAASFVYQEHPLHISHLKSWKYIQAFREPVSDLWAATFSKVFSAKASLGVGGFLLRS